MRKYLLTMLALSVIGMLNANPVSLEKATDAARQFTQSHASFALQRGELKSVLSTDAYHVFNIGDSGFVIISADDQFRPIVGYSYEGTFDPENIAPELAYYLDKLTEGRAFLSSKSDQPVAADIPTEWAMLLNDGQLISRNGGRAASYLCATRWNQNDPYNKYAPRDNGGKCYAGCVATAMSQVMKYWNWPEKGSGNHSYYFGSEQLSADFGATTYRWEHMPNSISTMSDTTDVNSIAYLMYHCGIAVDMMYGSDGSGAYSQDVPDAIMSYFGYSNKSRYRNRNSYTLEEWQKMLKEQFDLGWPCYYSGTDTSGNGGHAFVCDGYDDNDMFHFNWGWSGSGDGFYAIDELNVSSYAFNDGQALIVNFVPPFVFDNTAKAPESFNATPNGDSEFSVTLEWTNPSLTIGNNAIEQIDQIVIMRDGEIVKTIDNATPGENMTYTDPAGLPIFVNYTIHAVCNGINGKKAHSESINLGPTCSWTIEMGDDQDWQGGHITVTNASGVELTQAKPTEMGNRQIVEMPEGRVTFRWTAPEIDIENLNFNIIGANGETIFAFLGNSNDMPAGIFLETVNTCDGEGTLFNPTEATAEIVGEDIVVNWKGIDNPGYGYIIYRDGVFYSMVSNTTTFTDDYAASTTHCYFITAFGTEGETDPSNICCATPEAECLAPSNLSFEILENGRVKLHWVKPEAEGLSGYKVYRKIDNGDYVLAKLCGASSTSYSDSSIPADGTRVCYKITAYYSATECESAPAQALANANLYYVEVNNTYIPSNLEIVENAPTVLAWDAALLAETYNVYRNGERIAEELTETSFTDNEPGETTYRIYTVTGVLNGVESNPSNKAYWGNVSVAENSESPILIYPNPASNHITIEVGSTSHIVIFNALGQIMMELDSEDNVNINLSNWQSGVYFIETTTENQTYTQKIIKL